MGEGPDVVEQRVVLVQYDLGTEYGKWAGANHIQSGANPVQMCALYVLV
jgi:hypothetical protein